MSNRDGNYEIYVMDADGSNPLNVTETPGTDETNPSFSAEGEKILYSTNGSIASIPADGSGTPTTIFAAGTDGVVADQPAESPDGSSIALVDSVQNALWALSTTDSTLTQLTFYGAFTYNPAWSPDGSHIYFQHLDSGTWHIGSVAPDGTNLVGSVVSAAIGPAPSPDGMKLAFMGTGDTIRISNADGSGDTPLPGTAVQGFDLAWQPVAPGVRADFVVDSISDDEDLNALPDGVCETDASECTLRAAIREINASPAGGTIDFAIPADGTQTITLDGAALPSITKPVVIDGTTQRGFQQGSGGLHAPPPPGDLGIVLDGTTNGIDGLVLGAGSDGSTIRGLSLVNFETIDVGDSAAILVGSNDNLVAGNFVGVGADGTTVGRNGHGIRISGQNNTIGGVTASDRNVISGNREGIPMYGVDASGNTIKGNYVGVGADGLTPAPNDNSIVAENTGADGTTIGGAEPGAGNVFHSLYSSIQILGPLAGVADVTITSNSFGRTALGAPLPASDARAVLVRTATQVAITDNVVTRATDGIVLEGVNDATVSGNTVTDNANTGIQILGFNLSGNTISQNSIGRNGELGIDLGNRGVTSNDPFPDSLPQNAPTLTSVEVVGGNATVDYSVPGADEDEVFTVEFFASASADASGHGEGLRYLGSNTAETPTTVVLAGVAADEIVTATATDADGNTSEFSLGGGLNEVEIVAEADAQVSTDFPEQNYGSDPTADVYGGSSRSCLAYQLERPTYDADAVRPRHDPRRRDDHRRPAVHGHKGRVCAGRRPGALGARTR